MNNEVASALRALYTRFGAQLLTQPPRLASLLRDECPARRPEISALVKALEEKVPQDLLSSHSVEPPGSLAARLSKRLSEEHLLALEASRWAVGAWAHGLGLGDDYHSDSVPPSDALPPIIDPVHPRQGPQDLPGPPVATANPMRRLIPYAIGVAVAALVLGLGYVVSKTLAKTPPPHIATIDVPTPIRVGSPYTFTIHYDNAPGGVAAIERQVMQSTAKWKEDVQNQQVSGMENQSSGSIEYNFEPEVSPSQSTLQFVVIDRKGQRSAPQVVAYEIAPAPVATRAAVAARGAGATPADFACPDCGTIQDIKKIDEQRKPKGIGAVAGAVVGGLLGHLVGRGKGKVLTTAGGAAGGGFAGNAIEGHMTQTHWQIIIRMNGGGSRLIESGTEPAWHVGQRVKVVQGQILAK